MEAAKARAIVEPLLSRSIRAADPGDAVRRALLPLTGAGVIRPERTVVVAAGKAGDSMAASAHAALGGSPAASVIVAPPHARGEAGATPPGWDRWEADHPLPTERNVAAAGAVRQLVCSPPAGADTLLFLLSGGASALLALPVPPLTLEEVRELARDLMRAGAPIGELNTVRRKLGLLSGGRLAAMAVRAGLRVRSLIVSDIVLGGVHDVGSGPTVADPSGTSDALGVLRARGVIDTHARAAQTLERLSTNKDDAPPPADAPWWSSVENTVIASNADATEAVIAALRGRGYQIADARRGVTGEAREVGGRLAERVLAIAGRSSLPTAVVWGGETTVTVRGNGVGGRNQELALAAALRLRHGSGACLVASWGTDGIDGPPPSDAAGGVVTEQTWKLAGERGFDLEDSLDRNDAYTALGRLDALLVIGPSGTNVADVMIALANPLAPLSS